MRNEAGYGDFNRLEVEEFSAANSAPKPLQEVKTVRELLVMSTKGLRIFDELMTAVTNEARRGDPVRGVSPGGVTWQLGPLKKVQRVVEKLCLDPRQRGALDSLAPLQLDASGVLDTVRGMLTCNSMSHANLALQCFVRRYGRNGTERQRARGVRSKNRYANPSGGGWMDCLINVAVALPDGCVFVSLPARLSLARVCVVRAHSVAPRAR